MAEEGRDNAKRTVIELIRALKDQRQLLAQCEAIVTHKHARCTIHVSERRDPGREAPCAFAPFAAIDTLELAVAAVSHSGGLRRLKAHDKNAPRHPKANA